MDTIDFLTITFNDYIKKHNSSFSFTSLNPAGVVGPSMSNHLDVSNDFILQVVQGKCVVNSISLKEGEQRQWLVNFIELWENAE